MNKSPAEILEIVINSLNISKYKFSKEIGLSSPDHLYKILNGTQKPSWETLSKIVDRFPEVNDKFLLRGEGEVLQTNDFGKSIEIEENLDTTNIQSITKIQLLEKEELIKQLKDENIFLRSLLQKK